MNSKPEISICLGSSCFARGNKQTLKTIVKYLNDIGVSDKVRFHGAHCFGHCSEGPILMIDESMYSRVDDNSLPDILSQLDRPLT